MSQKLFLLMWAAADLVDLDGRHFCHKQGLMVKTARPLDLPLLVAVAAVAITPKAVTTPMDKMEALVEAARVQMDRVSALEHRDRETTVALLQTGATLVEAAEGPEVWVEMEQELPRLETVASVFLVQ
jgi:hypothetical protein